MRKAVLALFLVLLAGAIYFAHERILFADASYILFRIINSGEVQIQEYRYGSFITQAIPLLSAKLELPLNWIVVLYSASFNIFYLAVAALLLFKFKEIPLAILMSFYYVLFVSETYFWTNNEVHQGIAWMFLFFGTMFFSQKKKIHFAISIPLLTALCFLSVFTHPLVIIPVLFLWIFLLLHPEILRLKKKEVILFSMLILFVCGVKFLLSLSGAYDGDKLHAVTGFSINKVTGIFSSPLLKKIIQETFSNYWLMPLIFLAGCFYGLIKRKFIPILLTVIFSIGYVAFVCMTFHEFDAYYMESELMALSIIISASFVFYCIPALKKRTAILILIFIYTARFTYITMASEKFTMRKEWISQNLENLRQQNITKGIIYSSPEIDKLLLMKWGTPVESLIASVLQEDQPNITFVVNTPENIHKRMTQHPHEMISCFEIVNFQNLNHHYFSFDSSALYQVVEPKNLKSFPAVGLF